MISVCMATYNGEKYISEQLKSILIQLAPDDEIIISDDSSTDNTLNIVRELNDRRIIIFPNQTFKNPIRNFENALSKAKGDLIFLSDQDDIWVEGKVNVVKKAMQTYDVVVTDHSIIDENNKVILESYFSKVQSRSGILHNLKKNTYYGCCMAFKKGVLAYALPFPKDIPMHDIWLGFISDLYFKSVFIKYPYTKYRKHNQNVSNATAIKSDRSFFLRLKYRINIIKYLPMLYIKRINYK